MRLWTSRGSCPCPWRFIWGWGSKGGLLDAPSAGRGSPFSRKFTFAHREALLGPGAGAGPHGVAADLRDSLHKPREERRGEGGLPGVERYAAGGSPGGGRTWGSDPPPQDPLRPPVRGLEGPGKGGGETPLPPRLKPPQGFQKGLLRLSPPPPVGRLEALPPGRFSLLPLRGSTRARAAGERRERSGLPVPDTGQTRVPR